MQVGSTRMEHHAAPPEVRLFRLRSDDGITPRWHLHKTAEGLASARLCRDYAETEPAVHHGVHRTGHLDRMNQGLADVVLDRSTRSG